MKIYKAEDDLSDFSEGRLSDMGRNMVGVKWYHEYKRDN